MVALAIFVSVTIGDPRDRWLLQTVALAAAFEPLCVILHEAAHALAGALLGMRIFRVSIGQFGRVIYRRPLLGCQVEIRLLVCGGLTLAAPRSTAFLRLRWIFFVLAGPLANGVLALTAGLLRTDSPVVQLVAHSFTWTNIFLLGISVLPHRSLTAYGPAQSDGLAVLTTVFAGDAALRQKRAAYFALEATECMRRKDYKGAQEWCELGLQQLPDDPTILNSLAVARLSLGEFSDARRVFLDLAERDVQDGQLKAVYLNNVAWTDVVAEDADLLQEADRCSFEAMQLTPWLAMVKGTRGSVLLMLGRVDEATGLLRQAFDEHDEPDAKAINACYLAVALNRRGDLAQSRSYLEKARRLDPKCQFLPWALKEVR